MYSSFGFVRAVLGPDLDSDEMGPIIEYHRRRVTAVVNSQPDVPCIAATAAGFLQGFLAAGSEHGQQGPYANEMRPVLGGICRYGRDVTTRPSRQFATATGFFVRLRLTLEREPPASRFTTCRRQASARLVRQAFARNADVPVTLASLAGFALGVLYTIPYIGASTSRQVLMLLGTSEVGRGLDPE